MKLLSLIVVIAFSLVSHAQTPPRVLPQKKVQKQEKEVLSKEDLKKIKKGNKAEFIGIVQFLNGKAKFTKTGVGEVEKPVGFKTFFHRGDELEIENSNHYLKLVAQSRCVGVAYGDGTIKPPGPGSDQAWRYRGDAVRWICQENQSQSLIINDRPITLQNAEILYADNRLYVRRGRVLAGQGVLQPNQVYRWDGDEWDVKYDEEDQLDRWKLNNKFPQPKESIAAGPRPEDKVHTRWVLGPVFGGGDFNHENNLYNLKDWEADGVRAQVNFLWGNYSVIASLTYYEIYDPDDGEFNMGLPPDIDKNVFSRMDNFFAEIGLRSDHQKSWGYWGKIGIGSQDYEIRTQESSFSLDHKAKYVSTRVALGIEKTWLTKISGFIGLYTAFELYATHTLWSTSLDIGNPFFNMGIKPGEVHDLEGSIFIWGGMIHLGPVLEF